MALKKSELYSSLWSSCDELRGGMDASQYNYEKYLAGACQLEFLLEFNSHLGANEMQDDELRSWVRENTQGADFSYVPDLYAYSLELTLPMAERLYDVILSHGSSPSAWEVAPHLFTAALKNKNREQRIIFYGGFLDGLKAWQSRTMMQHQRFPFMFGWPPRLADAVKKYRDQRPQKSRY